MIPNSWGERVGHATSHESLPFSRWLDAAFPEPHRFGVRSGRQVPVRPNKFGTERWMGPGNGWLAGLLTDPNQPADITILRIAPANLAVRRFLPLYRGSQQPPNPGHEVVPVRHGRLGSRETTVLRSGSCCPVMNVNSSTTSVTLNPKLPRVSDKPRRLKKVTLVGSNGL